MAAGVATAVLGIPSHMGYGIVAVTALGDHFTPQAVIAGLYCAILVPLTALVLGARTTMIYAPRSVVAFFLGSVVTDVVVRHGLAGGDAATPHHVLSLVFLVVLLAGLIQAAFGALRVGTVVRYIPSPVMAGFQNAAAVLIFVGQIGTFLGLRGRVPVVEIPRHLAEVQPLTVLVGLVTAVVMWFTPRLAPRVSPAIAGLVAGLGAYHALAALGFTSGLGPLIGRLPWAIPSPSYLPDFLGLVTTAEGWRLVRLLASSAVSLAIVASLDFLLCAKTMEGVTGVAINGSREMVRLGLGNVVAACFGGVAGGVHLGSSFTNHRAGGRTPLSVATAAVVTLGAVLLLGPALARVPRVVVAGMLIVVSIQLVDRWSLQLLRKVLGRSLAHWQRMALDLLVVLVVAAVAIAVNLVAAVGLGVIIAVVSFLQRMSRSVIRRAYRGDVVHSRRTRDPRAMTLLREHGGEIAVFELEGPIFFGTAEDLAQRVREAQRDGVTHVILDLKRVNEIDSTGARILHQIHDRLAREGRHLLISHLHPEHLAAAVLRDLGVTTALTGRKVFADTDRALEWAEDRLIAAHPEGPRTTGERPLEEMDVLAGMDAMEYAVLKEVLVRREFRRGEVVFREGEEGHELFVIARGSASVKLRLPGEHRENRLATFSPGTVFGELALFDREPRSATIEADDDLVCFVLTEDAFAGLQREHPAVAVKLLTNLGRELSRRLRRANRMIYQLES